MLNRIRGESILLHKVITVILFLFQISISFAHSIGTRVRLSLMKSVAKRQKEKEPNAICSVSSFTARPMLRTGVKDQSTRFLSFVDAMLGFRHLLTQEDLDKAASMCQNLRGHLKSRFIVLSDDRVPPPAPNKKRPHSDQSEGGSAARKRQQFQQVLSGANLAPLSNPDGIQVLSSLTSFPPLGHGVVQNPTNLAPLGYSTDIQMLISIAAFPPLSQGFVQNPGYQTSHQVPLNPQPHAVPPSSDGFQVVVGRGGRRQSQRILPGVAGVAGIQSIKSKKKAGHVTPVISETAVHVVEAAVHVDAVAAGGLTEDLERQDAEMVASMSDSSPTVYVDAPEEA